MKTSYLLPILLGLLISNTAFSQDFLNFTANEADGYGVYANTAGHNIPIGGLCAGAVVAYYSLQSSDAAPANFPLPRHGALKLAVGGVGFNNLKAELINKGLSLSDIDMKFTGVNLGNDIVNEDWFVIGTNETRYYQDGVFTFYVNGAPIITGDMSVLTLEIAYNNAADCFDDVISGTTQYVAVADASAGQAQDVQDIAAAFLLDIGNNSIRFTFSDLEPAVQGSLNTGAIFESSTGKIEVGVPFNNMNNIDIRQAGANVCITPSTLITSSNSGNWLHVLDNGDRVFSILDTENMGAISAEFYINSGGVRSTAGGLEYLDRNFRITPTTQPTNPVRVRLYFTAAEWTAFKAASPDDLDFMSEVTISKFGASDCNSINNASNEVTVTLIDHGILPDDNAYFIDFEVSSFSSFFIHGPKAASILPVELSAFTGRLTAQGALLEWTTGSEVNNQGFEIQRSIDTKNWETIGWQSGNETTQEVQHYSFVDNDDFEKNIQYYRLKQIDFNDDFDYSNTVSLSSETRVNTAPKIFPVPAIHQFSIQNISEISDVRIINASGQVIESFNQINPQSHTFDCNHLPSGLYWIEIKTGIQKEVLKMVVI